MAELTRRARVLLGARGERVYGPWTIPDGGYRRLRVTIDIPDVAETDPTMNCELEVALRQDANTPPAIIGKIGTRGENTLERAGNIAAGVKPMLELRCPPPGWEMVLRLRSMTALELGLVVEAW